ncbi:sugar phosphate isomerase/epimerase family protein [Chelativorans intermedius]|uniref:Sugar phosphate isomerase/epimerase family protein n=1 Tax=Chelativorans intermedius TaxID=515947 RepID=A0ABV6D6I8_9HYPH|nr:sugar phosphate isomerase/epimerase family protein [Chelativorans intermedius]MCT8999456.1 sugar phosphate isomerase/epimerase [Chelativorans intermedius]
MRIVLCNEVLRPMPLAAQCAFARQAGYDGLEIAPFTLADDPTRLTADEITELRRAIAAQGLAVASLHWLTMAPEGLDLTSLDAEIGSRTRQALLRLVDLAAGLGAGVIVHGSPAQRRLGAQAKDQRAVAMAHIEAAARRAGEHGIAYCLEAINRRECNFLNTLAEAEAMIAEIGAPALRLMLDVCHAAQEEQDSLAVLAARYCRQGKLAHVQLNAANRRGPGQGDHAGGPDAIAPLLRALTESGYGGDLAVEPFDYVPDGPACAARAIGYVRGVLDGLEKDAVDKN